MSLHWGISSVGVSGTLLLYPQDVIQHVERGTTMINLYFVLEKSIELIFFLILKVKNNSKSKNSEFSMFLVEK